MSLCRLLKIAERIDSDDRAWLLNAINYWESGGQLDIALGLCGSAAISRRNLALKAVANILNDNNYTTWCVAGLLERAINRFETRVFTRYQKNKNMKLSEVDALLIEMFNPRCRVVRTQRQLFEIIG